MRQPFYVWNGQVIRKQPPWVVKVCRTPDTKNVGAPCAFPSTECKGGHSACAECGWSFCERHGTIHRQVWPVPRDAFKTFLRRMCVANNRRAKVQSEAIPADLEGPDEWLA